MHIPPIIVPWKQPLFIFCPAPLQYHTRTPSVDWTCHTPPHNLEGKSVLFAARCWSWLLPRQGRDLFEPPLLCSALWLYDLVGRGLVSVVLCGPMLAHICSRWTRQIWEQQEQGRWPRELARSRHQAEWSPPYRFPQADQQLFFFLSPLPPPDRGPENTERYCRLHRRHRWCPIHMDSTLSTWWHDTLRLSSYCFVAAVVVILTVIVALFLLLTFPYGTRPADDFRNWYHWNVIY